MNKVLLLRSVIGIFVSGFATATPPSQVLQAQVLQNTVQEKCTTPGEVCTEATTKVQSFCNEHPKEYKS